MKLTSALALMLVIWSLGSCLSARATTTNVDIVNYAFSPADVTIMVNDTVQWTWRSNYHSTTSDDALWDSGAYNQPHTYPFTFGSPGTYTYTCSIHYFAGSVTVQGGAAPPTVAVTNPPDGEVLSAPASLTLSATAASTGGSVTNVGFFQGGALLGNVQSSPYHWTISGLAAGDYTLAAVASDSNGLSATNAVTVHVVEPVALDLTAPQRISGTLFQFSYAATPGLRYVVQRSADVQAWAGISTNVAASNPVVFQDSTATSSINYYRVVRLPNP